MRSPRKMFQCGFTIVEATVVIVATGILLAVVALFIRAPVEGYFSSVSRAELSGGADAALRHLEREVHSALPNSLRAPSDGSSGCFEFLPQVGGGRYRAEKDSTGGGDILDFSSADSSFDVLASSGLPPPGGYATQYHVVIYNLGIAGADAYNGSDHNRAAIAAKSSASAITLGSANQFPFRSPGRRFQVIPDYSVVYSCAGSRLWRSTRAIGGGSLPSLGRCPGEVGTVLIDHVDCAASSFAYTGAASGRNGVLAISLGLSKIVVGGEEMARLYREVHVDNTP